MSELKPNNSNNLNDLEQRLLELIRQPQYQPAKPALLAKRLKLEEEQLRDLKRLLKRLIAARQLKWGPKHLVFRGDAWEGSLPTSRRNQRPESAATPRSTAKPGPTTKSGATAKSGPAAKSERYSA